MDTSNAVYDINNMIGFSVVGILIKLFFGSNVTEDGSSGPANASIWGYGVVALSVISLLFITFALAFNKQKINKIQELNAFSTLKDMLTKSLPSLLTLIVLIWIIILNISYFKRINQGKVADEYYSYSTMITLIVVLQIIALFMYLKDNLNTIINNLTTKSIPNVPNNKMAYVTYFLTFLNFIFIGITTIILEFFSTDG
jgi:hypothetical protein